MNCNILFCYVCWKLYLRCIVHPLIVFHSFDRILDNLPLVVSLPKVAQEAPSLYQLGFHVGLKGKYSGVSQSIVKLTILLLVACKFFHALMKQFTMQTNDEKFFIHNHLTFTVRYHKDLQTDAARIVGFEVVPFRSVLLMLLYCSILVWQLFWVEWFFHKHLLAMRYLSSICIQC